MTIIQKRTLIALLLGALIAGDAFAQSGPPPLPPLPPGQLLDVWPFDGTNYLSLRRSAPLSATNVALVPTWAGNGLQVDSTNAAWITYPVVATNGLTNLCLTQGTIELWLSFDFNSSDGLGAWGTILEAGNWNTNMSEATGAFGLFISPDGSGLYFSAQTNGVSTNYLNAPISWNAGEWHHIVLTYSASNSALYLEGQLAMNGPGVSIVPGQNVLTNGFSIGSDSATGLLQARAVFNYVATYNYELDTNTIASYYADDAPNVYPLPSSGFGSGFTMDDGGPGLPGGGGSGTNGGGGGQTFNSPQYTTNDFWVEPVGIDTNGMLTLLVHATTNSATYAPVYELLWTTNLTPPIEWSVWETFVGATNMNVTAVTVPVLTNLPAAFFQAVNLGTNGDSSGIGIADPWQRTYFGYVGVDPFGDPMGDGYDNLYKYEHGMNPNVFYPPPGPTSLNVAINAGGGSVALTWNPSPAPSITEYVIERADPNTNDFDSSLNSFQVIGTVSANTTSFVDTGSFTIGDPLNTFGEGSVYEVYGVTPNGNSLPAKSAMLGDGTSDWKAGVHAKLVRGPYGRWQLAFSAIPSNIQAIGITWMSYDYFYDYEDGTIATNVINVSDLVNSCYIIPDAVITNYSDPAYGYYDSGLLNFDASGFYAYVQGIDATGKVGPLTQAGVVNPDDPYFVDGRQHLQSTLAFLLQAGTLTQPYPAAQTAFPNFPTPWLPYTNNFIEVGFLHPTAQAKGYGGPNGSGYPPFISLDNNWPVTVDYALAQWLYSTNSLPSVQFDFTTPPDVLQQNGSYQSGPYWIQQNSSDLADVGASSSDGGTNVSLASGIQNIYGGPVQPALCEGLGPGSIDPNTGLPIIGPADPLVLSPGDSVTFTNNSLNYYYSQFQMPALQSLGYYSAPVNIIGAGVKGFDGPVQNYPLPFTPDFAATNQTPLMMGVVGQPMVIGCWQKKQVVSSYQYAYIGQYFQTNAYKVASDGSVTTNITGILSPYGEFLPTEPGPTALITLPDLTNGQTATNVVQVIKLQLDVNHDGTMDTSYGGPDNTSAGRPFKFWINDDDDARAGELNSPTDEDVDLPDFPDYANNYIHSKRDLEDYARLWILGMPALWASNGYQVTLSWTNIVSGSPAIKLFNAFETNGGIGYLTNSIIASNQIKTYLPIGFGSTYGPGYVFGQVASNQSFTFPNDYFATNSSPYFLFEGAGVGRGELLLTVAQNGTNIVSTSAFMNLMEVRDMFEHAGATNVTDGYPPSTLTSVLEPDNKLPADPTEAKQMIIFVHGINNSLWAYENSSETMFKRLYWSGYNGRFAAFRWPCASLPPATLNPFQYNLGEFYAWKSASALKDYLTYLRNDTNRLPGYSLNMIAHSQGNVVASEALGLGAPCDNYILTQGAIPAFCYDTDTNDVPVLQKFLDAEITKGPTPLLASDGGYEGYFTNLTGNLINFYNTDDFALISGTTGPIPTNWEEDQRTQKPESFSWRDTVYYFSPSTEISYRFDGFTPVSVTDPYEIKAMIARSRSHAIGAQNGANGVIKSSVDLAAQFQFGNTRPEHSGQFTRPIQTCRPYYQQVLTSFKIQPAP